MALAQEQTDQRNRIRSVEIHPFMDTSLESSGERPVFSINYMLSKLEIFMRKIEQMSIVYLTSYTKKQFQWLM